jgi:nucleoside-diphosphate-sugar epimerase
MRVFIAGASGVIGVRLVPLLVEIGHTVAGMTRSPGKMAQLRELGAEPVLCDVFDREALDHALTAFGPDIVIHQLTDLPDSAADLPKLSGRNSRIRTEGTRNLLDASEAAGVRRVIAQSISWEQPVDADLAVTAAYEHAVLQAGGVVIRYGQLYGPGTYYESSPPAPPRIHVDDAARLTVPVLAAPPGLTIVADDRAATA